MNAIKLLAQVGTGGQISGPGLGIFGERNYSGQEGAVNALTDITSAVSSVIGIMTIAAGIWFLIHILIGGLRWVGSEGDKTKLQEAQNRITNAFVGLIIVVAGWSILALSGKFLGFENILIGDPSAIIDALNLQQ